jgi:hypothetical protein
MRYLVLVWLAGCGGDAFTSSSNNADASLDASTVEDVTVPDASTDDTGGCDTKKSPSEEAKFLSL